MSKKNFKTNFNDILNIGNNENLKNTVKANKIFKEGRSTFIIRNDHLDKLKAISFLERKLIKQVLAEALNSYFEEYEKTKGVIQLPK